MSEEDAKTLAAPVGLEPVTLALAKTMAPVAPVDLGSTPGERGTPGSGAPDGGASLDFPGRYVEQGLLGKGGLGEVVEAFDQDLRRVVALKRPLADRMGPHAVARLVREAQVTAQLEHPNIVAVHTLGIDEAGRPFFTMTRLHGESLAALLARRRSDPALRNQLTRGRLLRTFAQVAYAVAFAHDRGVIHRDLKPENIVIGEFGEVRLVDWGIAKVVGHSAAGEGTPGDEAPGDEAPADEAPGDEAPADKAAAGKRGEGEGSSPPAVEGAAGAGREGREDGEDGEDGKGGKGGKGAGSTHPSVDTTAAVPKTRAGSFTGTPGYAAPEQAAGRADLDHRADIYALGALLYEMLAGRPPVVGETLVELVEATLQGRVQPLQELTTVPAPLASIVHKALSREPADRYGSALDMVADLEAALEGRPVSALEERKISRAKRWYMARSPRWARFRTVDVDSLMWGSMMLGFGLASLVAAFGGSAGLRPWWLWVGGGLLILAIPGYTALRKERPDDPGGVLAFSEGARASTGAGGRRTRGADSRGQAASPEETAPTQAASGDRGGSGERG